MLRNLVRYCSSLLFTLFLVLFFTHTVSADTTFSYSGIISDGHNVPIVNATIGLTNDTDSEYVLSDTSGAFNINVPAGTYDLHIIGGNSLPNFNVVTHNIVLSEDTVQNLTVPTQDLTVTVRDSSDNLITNATVNIQAQRNDIFSFVLYTGGNSTQISPLSINVSTNENGVAIIPFLPSSLVTVNVSPPPGTNLSTNTTNTSFLGADAITVVLPDAFSYHGIIRDGDGIAIANATVGLTNDVNSDFITTANDGSFDLHVPSGTYDLRIIGGIIPTFNITAHGIVVSSDIAQDLTVPTQNLTVRVVDSSNNAIVGAGVTIQAQRADISSFSLFSGTYANQISALSKSMTTGDQGVAKVPFMPSSTITLIVTPPENTTLPTYTTTMAFTGSNSITVTLANIFSYKGILRDGHGVVMPNITLGLTNDTNSDFTSTANDGSFEINVPNGTYDLHLTGNGSSIPSLNIVAPNILVNSDIIQNLTIPLQDLTVTVLNTSGAPAVNASVTVQAISKDDILPFSLFPGGGATQIAPLSNTLNTGTNGISIVPFLPSSSITLITTPVGLFTKTQVISFLSSKSITVSYVEQVTPTPTPTPVQLTSLSPAKIWVGLKNSDDIGIKFDLKAEVYKDTSLVSSGEITSVAGGSSGITHAILDTIPFNTFSPVNFPTGSQLSIKLYVRNACTGSGKNSGTARLWYNNTQVNSRFDATIGGNSSDYYLRDVFALSPTPGTGPNQTVDVAAGAKCSAYKSFGTWAITL